MKKYKKKNIKIPLRKKIEKIDKIYFDYDSDVIRTQSYPVLDDVAAQIGRIANLKLIVIEGHSSGEGTEEHNMDLSERRAQSVLKYLVSKGVDKSKLQIEAYGESRPIADNDTEEGRAKNRRVEFIIEENER